MTMREGRVFDIGYQRYEGPRGGRAQARVAIFKDGIRTALGIGRGWRLKIVPWLSIFAAVLTALIMAIIVVTVDRVLDGSEATIDLPSHSDYYGIASIILFLFAALVGPELLCPDRRSGVINLYLVRPLNGVDYVGARWTAFLFVMLLVACLPQFVLLTGLVLGDPNPWGYLRDNWLDVPKFLGAGFALALYVTTLALAVSAFTTRSVYAAVFLAGLFFISLLVVNGFTERPDVGLDTRKWLSLLSLRDIPLFLNDIIFFNNGATLESVGEGSSAQNTARLHPNALLTAWYSLWVAGPGLLLLLRYRRILS